MTVSKKIISLLAVMAIIVSLSGCYVSNKNAAATEDGYMNTVKSYYGEWKLDNVFQIPDVSYMTEDEALSGENETVVIQSDSFASSCFESSNPTYAVKDCSHAELQEIGITLGHMNSFKETTSVIEVWNADDIGQYCVLIILSDDTLLHITESGYVFKYNR